MGAVLNEAPTRLRTLRPTRPTAALTSLDASLGRSPLPFPEPVGEVLRRARVDFLARWPWDWFVTFTFRDPVHPEAADKGFREWISRVSECRRRRVWFDGVAAVRALELQRRGVIHFHARLAGVGKLSYRQARDAWREKFSWIEGVRPGLRS